MFHMEGEEPSSLDARRVRDLITKFVEDLHAVAPASIFTVIVQDDPQIQDHPEDPEQIRVESKNNFFVTNIDGSHILWAAMSDLMIEGATRNIQYKRERDN